MKDIHKTFDIYDYQNVLKRITQLRMKPNESIEDFSDRFLHLCYEPPGEDMDWDFFKQKFKRLVHISLHSESESPDVFTSLKPVNHETPQIS